MGKVICVEHHKGGIGKTTSTYNIAAALAQAGKKVLMIDGDPQASLTLSCGFNPADFENSITDVLERKAEVKKAVYQLEIENLFLIPSNNRLAEYQEKLNGMRAREHQLKRMAIDPLKPEYDYIFIDCPPQLTLLVINCINAADYVVIPCETSRLTYYNLQEFISTIGGINTDLERDVKVLGLFGTMYDNRTNEDRLVLKELQEQKDFIFLGVVPRAAAAKRGLKNGLPAVVNEPKEQISDIYRSIALKIDEIVKNDI